MKDERGGPSGKLSIDSTTDFVVGCCISLVKRFSLLLLIVVDIGVRDNNL